MKRRDELIVGATILVAAAVVLAGALWLSQAQLAARAEVHRARFRTVGGLTAGAPVVLRGVRVGRVRQIRLGERNWVETELEIYEGVVLPSNPAVIAASASLFGEWQAGIVSRDQPIDDPNVRRDIEEALAEGDDAWPGSTLPDIGQLTAQANRIATDIQTVSSRVQTVFDSQAVRELQEAIRDFGGVVDNINRLTEQQATLMGEVGNNLRDGSDVLADAARRLQSSLARIDEATEQGELVTILDNAATASAQVREAALDLRQVLAIARENQTSIVRMIQGADTVIARLQTGTGTLGLLLSDSTLYREATATVVQLRQLLADIQDNPRKYFKFSVF